MVASAVKCAGTRDPIPSAPRGNVRGYTDGHVQPCDVEWQREHSDLARLDGHDHVTRLESIDGDGHGVLIRGDPREHEASIGVSCRLLRDARSGLQRHRDARQRGPVRGGDHLSLNDRVALRRGRNRRHAHRDEGYEEKDVSCRQSARRNASRSAFSCSVKRAWNRVS
jgi:hypothetical protein